jgi:LssY-like putative type I secretion system component LssY
MKRSLRALERFLILLPGIVIAYLSVRDIFPYFNHRLPEGLAVLATYALGAYVLIPALIRVLRSLRPAKHLPLYCVTPDGFASDPLNIGVIGGRRQLIAAMERCGWQVADPRNLHTITRQIFSLVARRSYPTAPVSHLYLFGRKHDIAFEAPIAGKSGSNRHHVRFWATTYEPRRPLNVTAIHWLSRHDRFTVQEPLWLGAASLDTGVNFIRHNLQVTHMIHPDTNQERDLIAGQLETAGLARKSETIILSKGYRLINRAWRGYLQTDGQMTVVHLKRPSTGR